MMNFVHWIILCMYSKSLLFVFIFKRWRAPRRSWKNILMVLESHGKVMKFVAGEVGDHEFLSGSTLRNLDCSASVANKYTSCCKVLRKFCFM